MNEGTISGITVKNNVAFFVNVSCGVLIYPLNKETSKKMKGTLFEVNLSNQLKPSEVTLPTLLQTRVVIFILYM